MEPQTAPKDLRQLAEDWRDYRYYVLTTVSLLQQGQVDTLEQLQRYRRELDGFQRQQDLLKWKIGSVSAIIGAVIGTLITLAVELLTKHL